MGAGASQGFVEAADDKELEMPDAPEHLQALASRLSKAHSVAESIILQGLVALEPCVQRRLNRRITKPLDLACLRAFKAEMEGFLQASFFFGYMAVVCYAFFLMLGAVGLISSLTFVRYIYSSVHVD